MTKNKTVCIATFCEWGSYGSIMQAIGLKKTLNVLGFDSFIVRDKAAPPTTINFSLKLSSSLKQLFKNFINLFLFNYTKKRYYSCNQFIRDNLDCIYYNDYETLKKYPPAADYYITGSDQVWNPVSCNPAFFLDFVKKHPRLSYAASMGTTAIPAVKQTQFESFLNSIDAISVRESDIVEFLKKYTTHDIKVHIDPTFLISANQWREFMQPYPIQKPYILVFPLYWDSKLNKELKTLRRKSNIPVIALCTDVSKVWADQKIYDASPAQFLWLIDNAEAVISSSFHGIALALNLNKKISAVINPQAPSRIESLLNSLNVPKYNISSVFDFDISQYDNINVKIGTEKSQSIKYLKEILHVEK